MDLLELGFLDYHKVIKNRLIATGYAQEVLNYEKFWNDPVNNEFERAPIQKCSEKISQPTRETHPQTLNILKELSFMDDLNIYYLQLPKITAEMAKFIEQEDDICVDNVVIKNKSEKKGLGSTKEERQIMSIEITKIAAIMIYRL